MVIYWFYGRTHSPLFSQVEAAARTSAQSLGNFFKIAGYMMLFNGFCITLLAFLTIWGVTNEDLAKWHELDSVLSYVGGHINPEIADAFGLKIIALGAIVTVVGVVIGRGSKTR
jgi:hypothetical protein